MTNTQRNILNKMQINLINDISFFKGRVEYFHSIDNTIEFIKSKTILELREKDLANFNIMKKQLK